MEEQEMDWKRLVQFALLGSSDLEQYAILLVRVSLGLFFAISGANKLFVAGGTKPVYETLVKAKVPFPHQVAYFVSGVEFVGGSLLTVGLLSSPACVALLIDMIVAALTNTLSTVPKGLSRLNWLDDVLYLPEVLYVLLFIWLICSGPGKFSVDYWLAGKLLISVPGVGNRIPAASGSLSTLIGAAAKVGRGGVAWPYTSPIAPDKTSAIAANAPKIVIHDRRYLP
jgi:putative oxidoreductase